MDIKSLSLDELKTEVVKLGEKPYRAKQLYEWMHVKLARSYGEMTNLPKDLREKLSEDYEYISLKEVTVQTSGLDGTKKYLFELADGNLVESVWMQYHHGNSVCISSQVGCRMGCRFCASTLDGLLRFIHMVTDENGLNISQRNITVSTCGIVEYMKRLADQKLQITLALSLHGSTQEKRRELMPVANRYDISEVIDACRYYFDQTGRRVTFEYSLVGGVNDTDEDAENLCRLIDGLNCHVNLIPVNPIKERDYVESERKDVLRFQKKLEKRHINATIRREMGRDIDGACGQLRRRHGIGSE